jgi:circadian clock protein KaiC
MRQLDKAPTGIEGFDEITNGGLPRGRTSLFIGWPGSGKTVFALQTLVNGAREWQEPGIFVAFEEDSEQIKTNAASFGWDLDELSQNRLFFLDARMSADTVRTGPFDLTGMLASLDAKAREMGARRIVFDSIDVLLTLMNDPMGERQEIYRLHEWLSHTGLTGIITTRGDPQTPPDGQRFGFIQYTTDCTIQLATRVVDRVALRELRVMKYRGSGFRGNEFPFVIGSKGIEVAAFGLEAPDVQVGTERASTGVERLDAMLNGGYLRGSSVLITGSPGTAKSSLGACFVAAACERGERSLLVSYDETGPEIVRNMASISVNLQPYIDNGLLCLYAGRTESATAEEHLIRLRNFIQTHQPRCLVVDPLSAIIRAGGEFNALGVASRLVSLSKGAGLTSVFTSLLESPDPAQESTPLAISTIADTWIHLSYLVQGGERNRALTIIKSRGTSHSNQVRELLLSNEGISLADVYSAGGSVLMGTLRWEREMEERNEEVRRQAELERKRRELELAVVEANARIEILQREAEARDAELRLLNQQEDARDHGAAAGQVGLLRRRGADEARPS